MKITIESDLVGTFSAATFEDAAKAYLAVLGPSEATFEQRRAELTAIPTRYDITIDERVPVSHKYLSDSQQSFDRLGVMLGVVRSIIEPGAFNAIPNELVEFERVLQAKLKAAG